ncbi:MAG TPA: hypothetical protein VFZ65_14510 [Planctomycetota bacterium]|nr:hypothetical protein [Planctomycetota bacterium]
MAAADGLISYAQVAVCGAVLPAFLGLGLVRALGLSHAHGRRTTWAHAYLVGQLAMAAVTFGWLMLGRLLPGPPLPGWLLPLGAAAGGAWLLRRAARRDRRARQPEHASLWIWPPLAIAIALLAEACSRTNAEPIHSGDESAIWAAKAKVLFAAPPGTMHDGLHFLVAHPDYPLFNPLVQALAFASTGRILHWENRLPIQLFGVALLLLLSASATRRAHPLLAGLSLLAFTGTAFGHVALLAWADIMLACATLACVDALLAARETGERVWWRLACCALAAMLASKNEGAMLAVVVLGVFAARWLADRRGAAATAAVRLRDAAWLLMPAGTFALHAGFNRAYGLGNDLLDPATGGGRGLFERIVHQFAAHAPEVGSYYAGYLIDAGRSRVLPILLVLTCAVAFARRGRRFFARPEALLLAVFAAATAGYMLVFIGTNAALTWHLATAADRTMLHVLPLAVLGICCAAWPLASGGERARDGAPGQRSEGMDRD